VLWLIGIANAQEASGFVELRAESQVGVDGMPARFVQRFRPTFDIPLNDTFALSTTIEVGLSQGRNNQTELERTVDESDLAPLFDLAGCEWPEDPANDVLRIDGMADWMYVDRLYLDVYTDVADLRIGRQAVQWGSALLINPTDPFPQVLFTEPWLPRIGQNAIKATVPIKDVHRLQLFLGTTDTLDAVRASGRATVNVANADISAVGAYRGDAGTGLVGLDVRGTLGVGYWFEGAYHVGPSPYEEFAVGVDYSFPVLDLLLVGAQYYRNGSGSNTPAGLLDSPFAGEVELPQCENLDLDIPMAPENPYRPFTSGRDYALLNALLAVSPDVRGGIGALQNLGDGTGVVVPTVTVTPTGWLELNGSAQIPYQAWGDGGEFRPTDEQKTVALGPAGSLDLDGLVQDASFFVWARAKY
jgi:hypothetical protein